MGRGNPFVSARWSHHFLQTSLLCSQARCQTGFNQVLSSLSFSVLLVRKCTKRGMEKTMPYLDLFEWKKNGVGFMGLKTFDFSATS